MEWQLVEAKNRFSEVVRRALDEGPQRITRRGEAVIVIAEDEYRRLSKGRSGLIDYLLEGPSLDDVPIERNRAGARDVDL